MTKFDDKKFSVAVGSDEYRDRWDAVFGPKKEKQEVVGETQKVLDGEAQLHEQLKKLDTEYWAVRRHADSKWEEGKKDSATWSHRHADDVLVQIREMEKKLGLLPRDERSFFSGPSYGQPTEKPTKYHIVDLNKTIPAGMQVVVRLDDLQQLLASFTDMPHDKSVATRINDAIDNAIRAFEVR